MGTPTSNHRPLRAGIAIMPSAGEDHRGTLGAIARRKSDLAKVLVTALHVVSTHRNNYTVSGNEFIYQGGTEEGDKVGQLFRQTVNGVEKKSWAVGELDEHKLVVFPVDAAALMLPTGADHSALTSFNVHFPNDDEHTRIHVEKRPIVGPAVDPTPGMRLIAVGAGGGLRTFTVLDPIPSKDITVYVVEREPPHNDVATFYFDKEKNFTVSQRNEPSRRYDSGSPILWVDEHGNYRMVGIHFGGTDKNDENHSRKGFVSRATAIEEELGITFGIKMPTAVAGDEITVAIGAPVTLDASKSQSNEVLRDVLQYKWEKQASLTDETLTQVATTRRYTFQAPSNAETQVYKLTVTDGFGAKHTVSVTINVNTPPKARPGYNQAVPVNGTVTLTGSAKDPDTGHAAAMTYAWEVASAPAGAGGSGTRSDSSAPGGRVVLSDPNVAAPTFTPDVVGDYVFKLTVTDPGELSDEANVTIHCCSATGTSQWYETGERRVVEGVRQRRQTRVHNGVTEWRWIAPPEANAGADQVAKLGATVTLDGSGSRDRAGGTIASYSWKQVQGPSVTLTGADTASPTFTAPSSPVYLRFRLTVTDNDGDSDIDAVVVRATNSTDPAALTNLPPTADAGSAQTVDAGASVTLDGSGSSDPDTGDTLTYAWTQTQGPTVTLSSATAASPTFTAPSSATTLRFRLTVKDTHQFAAIDAVVITVNAAAPTPTPTPTPPPPDPTPEPPPPPTNITATATANSVTVSWDAVSGADDYNLEIGIPAASGGLGHTSHITTGTSVTAGSLLPQTTYEYRVQARNAGGDGPWTGWATVVTEGEIPPKPTNDQWDIQHSNGKVQAKVTEIPSVTPAITQARVHMSTGQPPNQTTVTKAIGTTLNSWVDLLASGDTGWATGVTWVASIRFENSVGNSAYSLPGKSVAVPTPPPPPPPPTVTHVWTWVDPAEYTGCGPTRKRRQECSNGHASHTRLVSASEPLRWGRWYNTEHERNKVVGSWTNTSSYRGCGPDRDRQQQQRITWENEQERQSHCGHIESRWVARSTTDTRWIGAPEPLEWGEWSDTGNTHYDDADGRLYKEQRRTSQCDDTQTRWVAA